MARCPECKQGISPWRTLLLETKSKPLVCQACGAVLRMKPGWLVRFGFSAGVLAQFVIRPLSHHSRGLEILTVVLLVVVAPLLLYALFAPAERAEAVGESGAG